MGTHGFCIQGDGLVVRRARFLKMFQRQLARAEKHEAWSTLRIQLDGLLEFRHAFRKATHLEMDEPQFVMRDGILGMRAIQGLVRFGGLLQIANRFIVACRDYQFLTVTSSATRKEGIPRTITRSLSFQGVQVGSQRIHRTRAGIEFTVENGWSSRCRDFGGFLLFGVRICTF